MKLIEDWSGHSKHSFTSEGTVLKHVEIQAKSEKKQSFQKNRILNSHSSVWIPADRLDFNKLSQEALYQGNEQCRTEDPNNYGW